MMAHSLPSRQRVFGSIFCFHLIFYCLRTGRSESLTFPLPLSASVCPTFSRYARLHRAALASPSDAGQLLTAITSNPNTPASSGGHTGGAHHSASHHRHHQRHNNAASSHLRKTLADPSSSSSSFDSSSSFSTSKVISRPNAPIAEPLAAAQPPPRVRWVVTADPDGLADRLVNAVSAFYFALLTDRILCIQPALTDQPGLETAFSAPNIDWTCGGLGPAAPPPDPDDPTGGGRAAAADSATATSTSTDSGRGSGRRAAGPPLSGPGVAFWDASADDAWLFPEYRTYTTFVRSNLNAVGPADATTILLRMHRGISVGLFHNPHHRHQLEAMGLRPDTAFGCAAQFLFGLSAETRAMAAADPELHALMLDEGAIKIGIQIRLGDDKILKQIEEGGQVELEDEAAAVVNGYLDCAEQVAASIELLSGPEGVPLPNDEEQTGSAGGEGDGGEEAPPPPPPALPPPPAGPPLRVYFYLMTDTLAVREMAKQRFGSRLLSMRASRVQFYRNVTADGLRRTALEHWYFSRCHHHVITALSGMGRTAAFASLRPGPSLFSMEVADGTRSGGAGCGLWDADQPWFVYNIWSGV